VGFQPGDPQRADILESGFARAFLSGGDGRQTTVRYVHEGELMGGAQVLHISFEGSVQFVLDSTVVHLDMTAFRQLVISDVEICYALAGDLGARFEHTVRIAASHAFGSVAQRLAADLLDRACDHQRQWGKLETSSSQQELADSVGSVREVVARGLAELRDRRLIETSRRSIRVLNPHGLDDFAAEAFDAGRPMRAARSSSAGA
jgi:CRP/FNR family transcriptional regulator